MKYPIYSLNRIAHACAALVLGAAATQASAQTVVFDSYGPNDATDGWPSWVYQSGSDRQDLAIPFTVSSATDVQSILSSLDGFGGVTFGIMSRQAAVPTGDTWLYSTHLVDPVANSQIAPTGWALTAGNYWLAAVADTDFAGTWQSGTEDYGGNWAMTAAGRWTEVSSTSIGMPAARITVTSAVPEPSSYALMLAGGVLIAIRRSRKQGGQS